MSPRNDTQTNAIEVNNQSKSIAEEVQTGKKIDETSHLQQNYIHISDIKCKSKKRTRKRSHCPPIR